jgi:glutathione S-transferase
MSKPLRSWNFLDILFATERPTNQTRATNGGRKMREYYYPAIVTLLIGLVYFWMALTVSRTHARTSILAPKMTGDPVLERTYRAHVNTLEWMPIALPSMWLFAIYWSPTTAASLGLVWIVGRLIYFYGYIADPKKRFPGFFIQSLAAFALLLGALGRILYLAATT